MAEEYVDVYTTKLPDVQVCSWLQANGVAPDTVLADQHILLKDGYMAYISWPKGVKVPAAGYPGFYKQARVTPLLVRPEEFGLRVVTQ